MLSARQPLLTSLALLVAWALAAAPVAEASAPGAPLYTAQRKPRVAVMVFGDTNTQADHERFGPSVSAMLVTYLKRQSQFVIVERQDLNDLLTEWDRTQGGKTTLSQDLADVELLERIDVILKGEVTVLEGGRIEIDAKLLSRLDGRIVTAAQRSGPESCLRQVVERLGIALEQDFLRPYYGSLRISFHEPENTHFYLTPVLGVDALDEEKPPVELGLTVFPEDGFDRVEPWVTNPTTYTVEKVLSGWYTVRLERPGYIGVSTDNDLYQAVVGRGETRVCWWAEESRCTPVARLDENVTRFLVHVEPRTTVDLDATARGFEMRKEQGAIRLVIHGERSQPLPEARVLLRGLDLRINPHSPDEAVLERWPELLTADIEVTEAESDGTEQTEAEDSGEPSQDGPQEDPCNFFEERELPYIDHDEQLIRAGGSFDLESFKGGFLAFEDYRGQSLPAGVYEMIAWAPFHRPVHRILNVEDGDGSGAPRELRLQRHMRDLVILGKTPGEVGLVGDETGVSMKVTTDLARGIKTLRLPVDRYTAATELGDQRPWERLIDLMPPREDPPALDEFLEQPPGDATWLARDLREAELPIKNGLWVGGRVDGFLPIPGIFYDPSIEALLDGILRVSHARRQLRSLAGEGSDVELLLMRLEEIDLLILDEEDMNRLRVLPEVTARIRDWVERGHALMAFVTAEGDYSELAGAPLRIRGSSLRRMFRLHSTRKEGFSVEEKIDLGRPWPLPKLKGRKRTLDAWDVVAFSKKKKRPCILEREAEEGYLMVWLGSSHTRAAHTPGENMDRPWYRALVSLLGVPAKEPNLEEPREGDAPELSAREKAAIAEAIRKTEEANDRILLVKALVKNHALAEAKTRMQRRQQQNDNVLLAGRVTSKARR